MITTGDDDDSMPAACNAPLTWLRARSAYFSHLFSRSSRTCFRDSCTKYPQSKYKNSEIGKPLREKHTTKLVTLFGKINL